MNIERVARTLLGAAALCGLLVYAGCNAGLSKNNSGAPPGGTPVPSVKAPGDWGMSLLAGGTVGVGMVPAKFQFDASAPITVSNCTSDYVAFNTSLAGGASLAAAIEDGSVGAAAFNTGDTITIANPDLGTTLTLTAGAVNSGTTFVGTDTPANNAANIVAAINRGTNGSSVGVTGSVPFGTTVRVTATAGSSGNSIIFSKTTVSPTSFSWNAGLTASGSGTASIVAFDQLYSTQGSVGGLCNQNGPSVDWAYYTDSTGSGTAVTSVVLSEDGTKVAFVENVGTTATLRILKWKAGEGTSVGFPALPTTTLLASQNWTTNCPAANSCMSSIPFSNVNFTSGAQTDTKSPPFYVYRANDVLFVGDNSGRVHKFTGVFFGAPAEVTTAPWPIAVNAGAILTGPVYDSTSGNIFVGDSTGLLSYIREVGSTVGTPACTLPCLGTPSLHVGPGVGGSIDDAPIVDGSTQKVIAINSDDGTPNFGSIVQTDTALVVQGGPLRIGGTGAAGGSSAIYSGAFDNTYITSSVGSIAGHMYVCGKSVPNRDRPAVFRLDFNASGVLQALAGLPLGDTPPLTSGSGEACSPVTEFFNTTTGKDLIFFSLGNRTNGGNPVPVGVCTAGLDTDPRPGCIISVDVTNPAQAWPPPQASINATAVRVPAGTVNGAGNNNSSTSGFIVDNSSASGQASSFYFTLGNNSTGAGPGLPSCNTTAGVGCAVKLTQSGLN